LEGAAVLKSVYRADSNSAVRKGMWVRLPPAAPVIDAVPLVDCVADPLRVGDRFRSTRPRRSCKEVWLRRAQQQLEALAVRAFPQHGAGRKHERIIRLESWQDRLVNRFPAEFLTGLIHSDGCRTTNRVTGAAGNRTYEYPRYFFSNNSPEIRGLFMFACQLLSIECRPNNPHSVSVARRASVARMDACIGRKA
jgi:hypothetical protein